MRRCTKYRDAAGRSSDPGNWGRWTARARERYHIGSDSREVQTSQRIQVDIGAPAYKVS
jgi:hypothetical protein